MEPLSDKSIRFEPKNDETESNEDSQLNSELTTHDELLDRVISQYNLGDLAESEVTTSRDSRNVENIADSEVRGGIEVEDIDKMLEKYENYTKRDKNSETVHKNKGEYPTFETFGNDEPGTITESSVDRIGKKYLAHLADTSEIEKNRALINDLRSNLRKKTLESMKKMSQKSKNNPNMNLTSALNSDRTYTYSQSEIQSLRFGVKPSPEETRDHIPSREELEEYISTITENPAPAFKKYKQVFNENTLPTLVSDHNSQSKGVRSIRSSQQPKELILVNDYKENNLQMEPQDDNQFRKNLKKQIQNSNKSLLNSKLEELKKSYQKIDNEKRVNPLMKGLFTKGKNKEKQVSAKVFTQYLVAKAEEEQQTSLKERLDREKEVYWDENEPLAASKELDWDKQITEQIEKEKLSNSIKLTNKDKHQISFITNEVRNSMVDGTRPRFPGEESLFLYSVDHTNTNKNSLKGPIEDRLSSIQIPNGVKLEIDEVESIEGSEDELKSIHDDATNEKGIDSQREKLLLEREQLYGRLKVLEGEIGEYFSQVVI